MKKIILYFLTFSLLNFFTPSYAKGEKVLEVLKQTGGVISGFTLGPVIGGLRGCMKGWKIGTDYSAEYLGDKEGSVHRSVGFLFAGPVVGTGGFFYGLLMGAYDGISYGISDPFSRESFSLQGDSILDYDLL